MAVNLDGLQGNLAALGIGEGVAFLKPNDVPRKYAKHKYNFD